MNINVGDLAGGAVGERLNIELQRAAENIMDPNTDWKKARKVQLTITLNPDENRDIALVSIDAKTTLAPARGVATKLVIGKDNAGKAVAAELKSGVKNQTYLEDDGSVRTDKGDPIDERSPVSGGNVVSFK